MILWPQYIYAAACECHGRSLRTYPPYFRNRGASDVLSALTVTFRDFLSSSPLGSDPASSGAKSSETVFRRRRLLECAGSQSCRSVHLTVLFGAWVQNVDEDSLPVGGHLDFDISLDEDKRRLSSAVDLHHSRNNLHTFDKWKPKQHFFYNINNNETNFHLVNSVNKHIMLITEWSLLEFSNTRRLISK